MLKKKEQHHMVLIHQVHLTEEDRAKLHDLLKVGNILQGALLFEPQAGWRHTIMKETRTKRDARCLS